MKIAILPGDGIGPDVVGEAEKILAVLRGEGLPIETERAPIGGAGHDAAQHPLPPATLALAQAADAVLLGAVGGPRYDVLPRELRPEQGLLQIRKALALFANLRPALLHPELAPASTLKADVVAGLDLMIVRELTGDIYFGQPRGRRRTADGEDEGFDTMHYRASEIERIARVGFETARVRGRKLCSVDKANVLDTSILWREVVSNVGKAFPDVALSHMYVDNAAMQLVRNPKQFDVIVTGNMFGDILSDEASMLAGLDRHAAVRLARRPAQGHVRTDSWLRTRHRGPGQGESAGDDPVAGDDVPLHVRAGGDRRAHRGRRARRAAAGTAHRRHRDARRADSRNAGDG
jgi:3-isopropylmalate dehydrogenase